jgi:formiminoglutamase
MYKPTDMSIWQGRVDSEEAIPSLRWHQVIQPISDVAETNAIALLGFCCDEGVSRNKGRPGAKQGPDAIRKALANQACTLEQPIVDAGDVVCDDTDLESAQKLLGEHLTELLNKNHFPIVMGGGHEVAWASYQGIEGFLKANNAMGTKVGIINFDAHLDLRTPSPAGSSGTPFRQIAEQREASGQEFNYCVIGMNPTANTAGLIHFAESRKVLCLNDTDCSVDNLSSLTDQLHHFIEPLDYLYLTVCLDVFPASYAPGVSAPAALGVDPIFAIKLVHEIKVLCNSSDTKILMADIAELNPNFDRDGITAKLAARLIHELVAI